MSNVKPGEWITPKKKKTARTTSLGRWLEQHKDTVSVLLGDNQVALRNRHNELDPEAEDNRELRLNENTTYVNTHFAAASLLTQGQTDKVVPLLTELERLKKKAQTEVAKGSGKPSVQPQQVQDPLAKPQPQPTLEQPPIPVATGGEPKVSPITEKPVPEEERLPVEEDPGTTLTALNSVLKGKQGIPEKVAGEFSGLLKGYFKAMPGLQDYFDGLMKDGKLAGLVISDIANDAFYNPGTKQIILPQKKLAQGDALDVVDALLFEIGNAEVQEQYTQLHEDFQAGMKPGGQAMSLQEHGLRKSAIEAEVTLKNAQALFALQEAEEPIAYQGQRNLDKVAGNILRSRMKGLPKEDQEIKKLTEAVKYLDGLLEVPPEEGRVNPPPRNEALDTYIKDIVRGVLPQLDAKENAQTKAAVVSVIQDSPHKLKDQGDPLKVTGLKTCEVYAFEKLSGVKAREWSDFLTAEVKKAFQQLPQQQGGPVQPPNIDEMGAWITDYVSSMHLVSDDYDYSMGRPQAVLDVVAKLKEFYPEVSQGLQASFDETFKLSEDMKVAIKARAEKQKEVKKDEWENVKSSEKMKMPTRGANNLTKEILNRCKAGTPAQTAALAKNAVDAAADTSNEDKHAMAQLVQWLNGNELTAAAATALAEAALKDALEQFALEGGTKAKAYLQQRKLDTVAANILGSRLKSLQEKGLKKGDPEFDELEVAVNYVNGLLQMDPESGLVRPPARKEDLDAYIHKIVGGAMPKVDSEEGGNLKADLLKTIEAAQKDEWKSSYIKILGQVKNRFLKTFLIDNVSRPLKALTGWK